MDFVPIWPLQWEKKSQGLLDPGEPELLTTAAMWDEGAGGACQALPAQGGWLTDMPPSGSLRVSWHGHIDGSRGVEKGLFAQEEGLSLAGDWHLPLWCQSPSG